ncbi:hypothetical protein EV424DRAFT_1555103 [Suillus variegatus]|nr:hypothetical protein EV424DRAFT_1555103 [Suillus variegatus]
MLSSPTTFYPNQHLSLQPIPSVHPNQPPKPPLSSSSDMMITKISTLDGKTSNTLSVPESEALVRNETRTHHSSPHIVGSHGGEKGVYNYVGVIFALFGPLQICHIRRHAKGTSLAKAGE